MSTSAATPEFAMVQEQVKTMQTRLQTFQRDEQRYKSWWYICEIVVLTVALLTPIIVTFRKEAIFPANFWVIWCTVTPLLAGLAHGINSMFDLKEKWKGSGQKAATTRNLIYKTNVELANCTDAAAVRLLYQSVAGAFNQLELN